MFQMPNRFFKPGGKIEDFLVLENNKVRILRATFGPGEASSGFFDAAGAVIVSLTPGYFEITSIDGKKAYSRSDFGAAAWFPPGRIQVQNLSDMNAEFIVIEPK
jgi:hypothetical protein